MSTQCMMPFRLSEENGGHLVPCGKCYNCKRRRVSAWSVRLMNQYQHSQNGLFITLTYDTEYVPITKKGFMSLEKKHLQNFIKRLRQWHEKEADSIKYYAVGEYGGKTLRPHYHIIIFNANVEFIEKSWSDCVNKKEAKFRKLGNIHYGSLTEASVGYTLKYICKAKKIPLHGNDDRVPEFALMSKGLGKNYLTQNKIQWHKNNLEERMYIPLTDGKKAPMPRYFKEKIYTPEEKELISYHNKLKADLHKEQLIKQYGDNYQFMIEQKYLDGNRKLNIDKSKI